MYATQIRFIPCTQFDRIESVVNDALATLAIEGHPIISITVTDTAGGEGMYYAATIVYNGVIASEQDEPDHDLADEKAQERRWRVE